MSTLGKNSTFQLSKSLHRLQRKSLVRLYTTAATTTIIKEQQVKPTLTNERRRLVFDNRSPSLQDFLYEHQLKNAKRDIDPALTNPDRIPYLARTPDLWGQGRKFYIEIYGCQMNVNDTEILNAIMTNSGYKRTDTLEDANIVFLVTCAIRDNAEVKIWERLKYLRHFRTKINKNSSPIVGVLGCMAERLKTKLLEDDKLVDIVCGPDGYRSIPHLISLAENDEYSKGVANVMLSADETYADIMPMRLDSTKTSGWVSIMRGCNNMCSFCIVPFTRGNERSRPIDTILDEVRYLSDQGVKEVTVLGQNVNSYRDESESKYFMQGPLINDVGANLSNSGFKTIYKRKDGGRRFTELLDKVSQIDPEMRVRFTSPHPKDFPTDLLHLIASRPNICNSVHLPIQSGSNTVLDRMRRGYTREAYLELVAEMRKIIPNVWISTDIITGFCGETEEEHRDTVRIMEQVKYDTAFMFAYSMREKTHAHRRYKDDVPEQDKIRRLQEIVDTFHREASKKNQALLGSRQLVLVDSDKQRSKYGYDTQWSGRTDGGHKVFIQRKDFENDPLNKGDYVEVTIDHATSASMTGTFKGKSSIRQFAQQQKRGYSTSASRCTDLKAQSELRSQYRIFLRTGKKAVDGVNRKHIKSLIREGFENKVFLSDPNIELKAKNTLELLEIASKKRGVGYKLVSNLCQLKYFKDRDMRRPPLFNRKMSPADKKLHDSARKELELTIACLNNELNLCLPGKKLLSSLQMQALMF
ncbi:hypothetical protein BDF20DRAFT_897731 [Mycotypha africana]|uniref:uncharacterized protein n=1 Tax=Mycotypha africana TaxID=64632 RepID=UPI002301A49B|nr:uncharacterized protein BDF20DRAFT_897731 [Mycotypha africana]KAI8967901.1 hypothetical protein BDF20DRAFT_897731 [Mycotypha africana]